MLPDDLLAMLETLDRGTLRGLRDRAMLLIGFTGNLRRSEIVGPDPWSRPHGRRQGLDRDPRQGPARHPARQDGLARGRGLPRLVRRDLPGGGRRGLDRAIKFARIANGPLFRRVRGQGKDVGPDRLRDREMQGRHAEQNMMKAVNIS